MQLERLLGFRAAPLEERDAYFVRAGRNEHARAQPLVDRVRGRRHVGIRRLVVFLSAHLRDEHALAVDADLELVRPLETRHVAHDVAAQEDREVVARVEREVVLDEQAAARAERQSFDVLALCEIGRSAERRDDRRRFGVADREARDLRRRRQVLLEQRRRHAQHVRDVVEAVAFVVGRQELGRVDLEAEQVADRVAVLGAVQADGSTSGRDSDASRSRRRATS